MMCIAYILISPARGMPAEMHVAAFSNHFHNYCHEEEH